MAMAPMSQNGKGPSTLSEINVTPLVDVMLVLLIIFMITSSMETVQAEQERQLLEEEKQRRVDEQMMREEMAAQQVPIELPKVNSEQVNLSEQQKLVLTLNDKLEFFLGSTPIARCHEIAPGLAAELAARARAGATNAASVPQGFKDCLAAVEDKLLENAKLKQDGELYLRADRRLDYGMVLTLMARIRKAGITKFGLVAEPDLEQ